MANLIEPKEMAQRLGITVQALNKHVKNGNIKVAGYKNNKKRFKLYDPVETQRRYDLVVDPSKQRKTPQGARGKAAENRVLRNSVEQGESVENQFVPKETAGKDDASKLAQGRAIKMQADAKRSVLKMKQEEGALLNRADMVAANFEIARAVRDRLMALPSQLQVYIDLEDMPDVTKIIHDIINDMRKDIERIEG